MKKYGDVDLLAGNQVGMVTGGGILKTTGEEKYCYKIIGYIEGFYDNYYNFLDLYEKYILVDSKPVLST